MTTQSRNWGVDLVCSESKTMLRNKWSANCNSTLINETERPAPFGSLCIKDQWEDERNVLSQEAVVIRKEKKPLGWYIDYEMAMPYKDSANESR